MSLKILMTVWFMKGNLKELDINMRNRVDSAQDRDY